MKKRPYKTVRLGFYGKNALKVDFVDIMEVLPREGGEDDGKQEASNQE